MSSDALLSELCSICYTEQSKYRCPGCSTRTCSLDCYKKHQQRASCKGKRNPAEYFKKSQLATPTGIDRDYNYLKGIERTIDHAGRETWDRGIGGKDTSRTFSRGMHPNSKVQNYLTSNRITVDHAPRGMSRQKSNNTRFSKRGHLMWTVEWIDASDNREVQDSCLESSSIDEIYSLLQLEKANAAKRKQTAETSSINTRGKKRKCLERKLDTHDPTESHIKSEQDVPESEQQGVTKSQPEIETSTKASPNPDSSDQNADGPESAKNTRPEVKPEASEKPTTIKQLRSQRFYYLLKPGTTSSSQVLIPLSATSTLTASLRDQIVLEYPTLYVLPHCPDSLPPEEFMLETQYLKSRQSEEEERKEAMHGYDEAGSSEEALHVAAQNSQPVHSSSSSYSSSTTGVVDANRILDMLRRDVTR